MNIAKLAEELLGDGFRSTLNLMVSAVIGPALSFFYTTTPIRQGLESLTGVDVNSTIITGLLAVFAIASSTSGLQRGIKWPSSNNTLFFVTSADSAELS